MFLIKELRKDQTGISWNWKVNMPQEIVMWEMEGNNTILQVKKVIYFPNEHLASKLQLQ